MKKEEILAMEAGDELNALVAREVMEDDLEHFWREGPSQTGVKYCAWCSTYDWMPAANEPCSVKPYSEDISAAFAVVERIGGAWDIKRRYRPYSDDLSMGDGRPTYQALVVITEYEDLVYTSQETFRSPWCWQLPEAICKAALLAKLGGKGEQS